MRPADHTARPNLRPARCTLRPVRDPGGTTRPKLTLIDGGLSEDAVESKVAATKRGRRWPHPAGRDLEPKPKPTDGPEAV
jgi:hypothetical protein